DIVLDAFPNAPFGKTLALELQRKTQSFGDIQRFEQLEPLREGQIRRVAGGVRQRPRVRDRAKEGADAPVVAAKFEQLLDDGSEFALELTSHGPGRHRIGPLLDV